jgi:hypothetical protein
VFGVIEGTKLDVPRIRAEVARLQALAQQAAPPAPQAEPPTGWKLVPVEPTQEMLRAATDHSVAQMGLGRPAIGMGYYSAMIAAAPTPAAQAEPDIADIVAGELQTSRAHAYELMRAALAAQAGDEQTGANAINPPPFPSMPQGAVTEAMSRDELWSFACLTGYRAALKGQPE